MTSTVRQLLLAHVEPLLRTELEAAVGLEGRLDELLSVGRASHPDLELAPDAWVRHFVRHLRSGELLALLDQMRADDVHLVLACLACHPVAHRKLEARLLAIAPQALVGVRLGTLTRDELLREVRTKLLVGSTTALDNGTPLSPSGSLGAKLALYSGRGPLDGWLRVIVTRTALTMLRPHAEDAAFDAAAMANVRSSEDPHFALLRARAGPPIETAIRGALASLGDADRTLLRLYFVDGLTLDDLASVYRAHRATMSRRLARIRNAIFEHARTAAMASLGASETEFQSLVGDVLGGLDVTLRTLLAPPLPSRGDGP